MISKENDRLVITVGSLKQKLLMIEPNNIPKKQISIIFKRVFVDIIILCLKIILPVRYVYVNARGAAFTCVYICIYVLGVVI